MVTIVTEGTVDGYLLRLGMPSTISTSEQLPHITSPETRQWCLSGADRTSRESKPRMCTAHPEAKYVSQKQKQASARVSSGVYEVE